MLELFASHMRRSGDKRRARAETGGPVVLIWCVTSCFGGALVGCGYVRRGKSRSSDLNWLAGVRGRREGLDVDPAEVMP